MNTLNKHLKETGETYPQHLWFAIKISPRLFWVGLTLLLHGIFPFIFTHTTSSQIEKIYVILKSRIPQSRRKAIDTEYEI